MRVCRACNADAGQVGPYLTYDPCPHCGFRRDGWRFWEWIPDMPIVDADELTYCFACGRFSAEDEGLCGCDGWLLCHMCGSCYAPPALTALVSEVMRREDGPAILAEARRKLSEVN